MSNSTTTKIHAVSRLSTKIGETFYTFEFMEERILDPLSPEKLEKERQALWDTVHEQVDNEVEKAVNNM